MRCDEIHWDSCSKIELKKSFQPLNVIKNGQSFKSSITRNRTLPHMKGVEINNMINWFTNYQVAQK